jgi:predicted nucleotidyltransferase
MNRRVLRVVRDVSHRLVQEGAEAVVLMGSYARGEAYAESDLDIHAVGKGPPQRLEHDRGLLISVSWATRRQAREAFRNPRDVGAVIPAWRSAIIIHDPDGIARTLKKTAQEWNWKSLGSRLDRWVAEELTSYAEEAHKLVGNLRLGHGSAAAVQRSLLAVRMAPILAVYHRILYDTENQLWDLVSKRMGAEWTRLQSIALGETGRGFEQTCRAALQLFSLAAQEVKHLMDERQYAVVVHACEIAGYPLPRSSSSTSQTS